MYLDATGLVDVAETYSRIDNFIDLVQVVIDKVATVVNKLQKDDAQSPEEATASADGEKVLRDAILALTYSDTTFQIQITKSLISLILATLLPDLGSIDEVFDQLEINLGVDIGREDYRRVSDLSTTILYNEYTVGTKKGYLPLSEYPIYRQDAQDNWVTAEYDPLQDNYVFYNGHYYEVTAQLNQQELFDTEAYQNERYHLFEEADFTQVDNHYGKYAAVELSGEKYLPISVYKLYHRGLVEDVAGLFDEDGNRIPDAELAGYTGTRYSYNGDLVPNEKNAWFADATNYIKYGGSELEVLSLRTRSPL